MEKNKPSVILLGGVAAYFATSPVVGDGRTCRESSASQKKKSIVVRFGDFWGLSCSSNFRRTYYEEIHPRAAFLCDGFVLGPRLTDA
jgi:hypothetical protein